LSRRHTFFFGKATLTASSALAGSLPGSEGFLLLAGIQITSKQYSKYPTFFRPISCMTMVIEDLTYP
jgi:hypothetical protein